MWASALVPNVMVALPKIGGALCSMLQSLADAHYLERRKKPQGKNIMICRVP